MNEGPIKEHIQLHLKLRKDDFESANPGRKAQKKAPPKGGQNQL